MIRRVTLQAVRERRLGRNRAIAEQLDQPLAKEIGPPSLKIPRESRCPF